MAKPAPVPKHVVCSVCDLPWEDHMKGRKTPPDTAVCIRLLKAEVAKRPRVQSQYPFWSATTSGTQANLANVTPISQAQHAV